MDENITRWRLILGQDANALGEVSLNEQQSLMDATLAALYDDTENNGNGGGKRSAGLGNSAPNLAKWLTDVRSFFPRCSERHSNRCYRTQRTHQTAL